MKSIVTLLVIFLILGAPLITAALVAGSLGVLVDSAIGAIYEQIQETNR